MSRPIFRVATSIPTPAAAVRPFVLTCRRAFPSTCSLALQSTSKAERGDGDGISRHCGISRRSLTSWAQRHQIKGHGQRAVHGYGHETGSEVGPPHGVSSKESYTGGARRRHASSLTGPSPVVREKNRTSIYYAISIILGTVALSYAAVPLYKTICQQTGWGGQPVSTHLTRSSNAETSSRLNPVSTPSGRRIRVTFNGSVSDVLPWKFTPQQREVRVYPGETALAFYTATNRAPDRDIVGIATYSVTPGQAAPYFSKIQCFCFEEQRLNRGESVDMPVFFFIDPDFVNDPAMAGIETITLSYTFFKAKYDNNGKLNPVPGAS